MPGPVPAEAGSAARVRLRPRNALRPVAERPVRPDVDLAHLADRAGPHVLDRRPRIVPGVALVAHLRGEPACSAPCLRELARLGDRPGQRLLHVDVLAEIHRGQRDRRVHVIRRRDDDRVDVLLLVEHLRGSPGSASRAAGARLRGASCASICDRHPLADRSRLSGAPCRPSAPAECVWCDRAAPAGSAMSVVEASERLARVVPVHVAQRDDVLAREVDQVGAALAADADRGDVEQVARRGEAAAEHVARDDRRARRRRARRR